MCRYPLVAPPFSLKFDKMSRKELDAYYRWYLDQIPNRIVILEAAVKCTPGFEDWKADCSPESMDKLGAWFAGQVETRERTREEIEEARADLSWPANSIDIGNRELTNRTFSIAVDIGMYLSQALLRSAPALRWEYTWRGSKRWIDYGQPVLAGLRGYKGQVFNPTGVMVGLAYALADRTWKGSKLREIFEFVRKAVSETQGRKT